MAEAKKIEEEEESKPFLSAQPTIEQVYKEMGLDQDIFREQEHQLVIKIRPPTLDKYQKHAKRIIVTPKPFNPHQGPIFHESKDVMKKYKDRRPKRPIADKEFIGTYVLQKAKEKEKKMDTNTIKWDLYTIAEDDDEEEVEGEGEDEGESSLPKGGVKSGGQGPAGHVKEKPEDQKNYQDAAAVERASLIVQKYIQRWEAWKVVKELRKRKLRRKNLGLEILQTEKDYVHHLQVSHQVYWTQLKQIAGEGKYGFKNPDFTAIFTTSYGSMKMCNETFLDDLEKTILAGGEYQHFSRISNCFLKITPFLKTYKDYCSNFSNAVKHLRNLKKDNQEFNSKLGELDKDDKTTKLGLNSYLILPIQRVPRYRMLLKDFMKYTEVEHPDYASLGKAHDSVLVVAKFLDNAINKFEAREKVVKIHEEFVPNPDFSLIDSPHRRLLDEFDLPNGVEMENGKSSCAMKLLIFSDILCFANVLKGKFKYEYVTHYSVNFFRIYTCSVLPLQLKLRQSGGGEEIIIKFENDTLRDLFLEKMKKVKKESAGGGGQDTEFERSPEGVAISQNINLPAYLSDSDCVQLCKKNPFYIWKIGRKIEMRETYIDEEENYMVMINPKTKSIEKQLQLKGDLISELVVGQKTKAFMKKEQQLKELRGISFSLRYGVGNMHPTQGWTGETLDLICQTKKEYLVWTRALKFILLDQGKTLAKRQQEFQKTPEKFTFEFGSYVGNDLLTWGRNVQKSLGHFYLEKDLSIPKHVRSFLNLDVNNVQLGEDCVFVILNDGKVFSFGINTNGKLGHKNESNVTTPTLIKKFMKKRIIQISCGKNHTLFLEDNGCVYSCGSNDHGQLGVGKRKKNFITEPIKVKKLENVKFINAGQFHSSAVMSSGECYMWGGNNSGQLGTGDKEDKPEPFLINKNFEGNPDVKVTQTALGAWHSLFLDETGNMYSCGDGSDGQLGNSKMGKGELAMTPNLINFGLVKGRVKQISSGSNHCGCVIKQGKVYMWGQGQFGQIGNGQKANQSSPTVLTVKEAGDPYNCKQLSCGQSHTLALIEGGGSGKRAKKRSIVCAWGSGTSGRLGIGKDQDVKSPVVIMVLEEFNILRINAGGCLSACVTEHVLALKRKELQRDCFGCGNIKGKKKQCLICSGLYCKKCLSKRLLSAGSMDITTVCDVCYKIMFENQSK